MLQAKLSQALAEIEDLCMVELDFIRAGRLRDLAPTAQQKQNKLTALQEQLTKLPRDVVATEFLPRLEKIKQQSERTGELYKAILMGVKSAQERLSSLKTQAAKIGTYDIKGKQMHLEGELKAKEKRI